MSYGAKYISTYLADRVSKWMLLTTFAPNLISQLSKTGPVSFTIDVFKGLRAEVFTKTNLTVIPQKFELAHIPRAGHEGGDFVFRSRVE